MGIKGVWRMIKTAGEAWVADNAPRLGAALSFYTVFAVSPLFIIIIFIASLWFNRAAVSAALFNQLASLVGQQGAHAIQSALTTATPHDQGKLASAIAVGTLIVTTTGVFIELQGALNAIWGVEEKSGLGVWGFIKDRLLSFAMVIGIGFLLLVSLVLSAALAAVAKYISALVPGLGELTLVFNGLVSFAVITVLFAMVFKILPDVKIAWRDVWIGAGVTALLFTGGKFLLGLYLGRSSTVSAYGAAGSLIVILLWVYYSAQIVFFGAELTQIYANHYGVKLEPKQNAQWIRPHDVPANLKPHLYAAQHQQDPKEQLVSELRQQVDSLRDARLEVQARAQERKHRFWRRHKDRQREYKKAA